MPLSHVTSLFNIDDCKIYPLTSDPSSGSPTYGSGVDVPGIRELNVTFDMLSKELYGDAKVLSQKNKVRKVTATASHAKVSLDALVVFLGGAVTDSGSTPNMKSTYKLKGASQPAPFKLEAQILAVDHVAVSGDAHLLLWKCTAEGVGVGGAMEDFSIPSLSIVGVPLICTDDTMDIILEETAVALT